MNWLRFTGFLMVCEGVVSLIRVGPFADHIFGFCAAAVGAALLGSKAAWDDGE